MSRFFLGYWYVAVISAAYADNSPSKYPPPEIPTRINLGVNLVRLFEVDPPSDENPKVRARFNLRMEWRDRNLELPSDVDQVDRVYFDVMVDEQLKSMFDPAVVIVGNSAKFLHNELKIRPNGDVVLDRTFDVEAPADLKLNHFPFDNQTFKFSFASLFWFKDSLEFFLDPLRIGASQDAAPKSWKINYTNIYVEERLIFSNSEKLETLNIWVNAQRDPRFYIWRLIFPLIIIVILSWNVFWIYEDSDMALANCFIFVLTIVAFHQTANDLLPARPFFTFIDAIVFISYAFIIVPSFEVMITARLRSNGKKELATKIREICRLWVPIVFVLSILSTIISFFTTI